MPAFNEAPKIAGVIDSVPVDVLGRRIVLVVVDDGSTDTTADVATDLGATVLRLTQNRGKGSALKRGLSSIRDLGLEAVVWMDSDGQHSTVSLPDLVGPVLDGSADMVVGSRYLSPSPTRAPFNRRLIRRLAVAVIRRMTGLTLSDPFSGYRCFSPAAVDTLDLRGDCYESELEALFCVWRAGMVVTEVPVEKIYGPDTSKMGHHRGRLRGRLAVVGGYARTMLSAASSQATGRRGPLPADHQLADDGGWPARRIGQIIPGDARNPVLGLESDPG